MVTPYFSSIRQTLVNALCQATESIDIAVAWFTNEQLFDTVMNGLDKGVKVRMVLINDDINQCGGLDFQKFIDKGGRLFFGKTGYFMHNKYCIIDGRTVYTGSYNYTYFAEHSNFENIVCINDDEPAVTGYIKNYEHILSVSDEATNVEAFLKVHPFAVNTHATRQMRNRDLYQKANEYYEKDDARRGDEIIKSIMPNSTQNPDEFVIRDVLYKQWRPDLCIQRIEVSPASVVFDVSVGFETDFFVYGPGLDRTWHIKTATGTVYAAEVSPIKSELGSPSFVSLEANTIYQFSKDPRPMAHFLNQARTRDGGPLLRKICPPPTDKNSISFRLVFPKGDYFNESISLYEGPEGHQTDQCFWHFLNINMCLNREAL